MSSDPPGPPKKDVGFAQLRRRLAAAREELGKHLLAIDAKGLTEFEKYQQEFDVGLRSLNQLTERRRASFEATARLSAVEEKLKKCCEAETKAFGELQQAVRAFLADACQARSRGVLPENNAHAALGVAHDSLCRLRIEYDELAAGDTKGMWGALVSAGKKTVLSAKILMHEQTWFTVCDEWLKEFVEDCSAAEALRCESTEKHVASLASHRNEVNELARKKRKAQEDLETCKNKASLLDSLNKELDVSTRKVDAACEALIQCYREASNGREHKRDTKVNAAMQTYEQLQQQEQALVSLYGVAPESMDVVTHSELNDKQQKLLGDIIHTNEQVLWQLVSVDGVLVCTTEKVVILSNTSAFQAFNVGTNTFTAPLRDIVSVHIKTHMGIGLVQVITAGMPASTVDPWSSDARLQPNIWRFGSLSSQATQAREAVRCVLAKVRQTRERADVKPSFPQAISVPEQLEKLFALKEKGILSDEEFLREKAKVLQSRQ